MVIQIKKKGEYYILFGDTEGVCNEQICNNEKKYNEDENSDYYNSVFKLLKSLVQKCRFNSKINIQKQ